MTESDDPEQNEIGAVHLDVTGRVISIDEIAHRILGDDAERLRGLRPAELLEGPTSVIASVGHELRSPLTSIRGYTSLLLNRWDRIGNDDKLLMLDQIHHDAERVTRLIDELLDISRIESGELVLARSRFHIADLVNDVVNRMRTVMPALEIDLDLPTGGPVVEADSDKIEQVLTNLLENAVKYGDGRRISVQVREDGDSVITSVGDEGPGVAADDRERIFERGYQHEDGRPSGTGLGLWISRNLIEAHGGHLELSTETETGALFLVRLPRSPDRDGDLNSKR